MALSGLPVIAPDPAPVAARERVGSCLICGGENTSAVTTSRVQMLADPERFTWVQCQRCGLVFLDPRVPEPDIGRYYADYLPHRGPAAWGRWAPLVRSSQERTDLARLRTLRGLGPLDAGCTVLDIGCGQPSFLRVVRDRTGARAVGTDFDASGWSDQPQEWAGLELHAGILEELPLTGPFDRITLWHVLEHLYRPVETLRYLRSLVRPGTLLVVEVPDHDGVTRKWQGEWWAGYHTPRHTAAYTPATLRGAMQQAGWTIVKQYQWGTLDPYVLWWLGEQERRNLGFTGSFEHRFVPFVLGKIAALPVTALARAIPLGFQTAIAVA